MNESKHTDATADSHISDEQLVLLYYGESDDPQVAARVANSEELSARLARLSAELEALDRWDQHSPQRDDQYGRRVWARLQPQLPQRPQRPPLQNWLQWLTQPRWSWAGLASVLVVASLAFWLGGRSVDPTPPPFEPTDGGAAMNPLLAHHLSESERWLAHVVNQPTASHSAVNSQWAQSLLQRNRLYRLTLQQQSAHPYNTSVLNRVLGDLEFILLQQANTEPGTAIALQSSDRRQAQTQAERVLFQLRVLNQQRNPLPSPARGMHHEQQTRT